MEHNIKPEIFITEVFNVTVDVFRLKGEKKTLRQKNHNAMIIDIRGEEEYKEGHIIASSNLPFQFLDQFFHELRKNDYADTVFYLFCWAGNTSLIGCAMAKNYGFQAKSIEGGATGWQLANLPFVKQNR